MNADSLDALRDVHLPPTPALWSVPEWAFAATVLALLAGIWLLRRYIKRHALRASLRELAELESAHALDRNTTRFARGLSRLLRRHAMTRYPHAGVEGLTGDAWLRFLDANGGNGAFATGGAPLAIRPYQAHGDLDAAALVALARQWLKANP